MLDPNNENGPIPFTSSALLVIAYVRLSLNIGSYRHLESRDPEIIASGLSQLPDIERNELLLSALLYSTHALSIPVRLGIDRVARSQAFFWSVQHAISSFECAIFLGKWLCSLSRPLQEASLSRKLLAFNAFWMDYTNINISCRFGMPHTSLGPLHHQRSICSC